MRRGLSSKKKEEIRHELQIALRKEQKSSKQTIMIIAVLIVIAVIAATLLAVNLLS